MMDFIVFVLYLIIPIGFMLLALRETQAGYENYKLAFYAIAAVLFIMSGMIITGTGAVTYTIEEDGGDAIEVEIRCPVFRMIEYDNADGDPETMLYNCIKTGTPLQFSNATIRIESTHLRDILEVGNVGYNPGSPLPEDTNTVNRNPTTVHHLIGEDDMELFAQTMGLFYFAMGIVMVLFALHEAVRLVRFADGNRGALD